jgi:SAM-dependent MidA family methyltransferase
MAEVLAQRLQAQGGWMPFEQFMHMALYEPGLGYYASAGAERPIFGVSPRSGSDFVTAPQMSAAFGQTLAVQLREAIARGCPPHVVELGPGTGALAADLLQALPQLESYTLIEVSANLRKRQQQRLAAWGDRVVWSNNLPDKINGIVLGNEVLDALPVMLLKRQAQGWVQRGVGANANDPAGGLAYVDRPWQSEPGADAWWDDPQGPLSQVQEGSVVEVGRQAYALTQSVAQRLVAPSMALMIDYGFPADEFYHPQRTQGTLMCHQGHKADSNPLVDVGLKDITAHVDFTSVALAAQAGGADVLGYTSQGRYLLNLGILDLLARASTPERSAAHRLIAEHEMGELFKVIAFGKGLSDQVLRGFAQGDRTHRL